MRKFLRPMPVVILVLLPFFHSSGWAEGASSDPVKDLLAQEKMRDQVESLFDLCRNPPVERHTTYSACIEAADRLILLGPGIIPFMENEILQETPLLSDVAIRVLGEIPSPESARILKETVQRYDRGEQNDKTRLIKAHACFALALQGDPSSVDLVNSGRMYVGLKQFYKGIPATALTALLTAPGSESHVLKQIELYGAGGDVHLDQYLAAVMALSYIARPSHLERLSRISRQKEWPIRMSTVEGFRRIGTPDAVEELVRLLRDDPDGRVRSYAVNALNRLKPPEAYEGMKEALRKEKNPAIRGILYKTLAQIRGAKALPDLAPWWGREEPQDRRVLVEALGWTRSPKALSRIRQALEDPRGEVRDAAVNALDRIGTPGAVETLLATLDAPEEITASYALEILVRRGEGRAAPRIASRLLRKKLSEPALPADRQVIRNFGEALISLEYPDAREEIADAIRGQSDLEVREYLPDLTSRLFLLEKNGNDVSAWSSLLNHENRSIRDLARIRLARIGSAAAVTALLEGFDDRAPKDQAEIVTLLRLAPGPATTRILKRILISGRFDGGLFEPVQAAAAWAAGTIGGTEMAALLREASQRDSGRSFWNLLYLMKAEGADAVPYIYSLHVSRLRTPRAMRWRETRVLETIADDLKAGIYSPLLDLDPEHFELQLR